jgi:hypothetical protein
MEVESESKPITISPPSNPSVNPIAVSSLKETKKPQISSTIKNPSPKEIKAIFAQSTKKTQNKILCTTNTQNTTKLKSNREKNIQQNTTPSQSTATRLTHSSRSSSSLGSGCLYTLLTQNLPVSALFLIAIGNIKYLYHFCSNLAPFLYFAFFSQISVSVVLELGPQTSLSHFSFLNIL